MNNWISIQKQLPTIPIDKINEGYNRKQVLVSTVTEPQIKLAWFSIEDKLFYNDYNILSSAITDVLAWQSIPEVFK